MVATRTRTGDVPDSAIATTYRRFRGHVRRRRLPAPEASSPRVGERCCVRPASSPRSAGSPGRASASEVSGRHPSYAGHGRCATSARSCWCQGSWPAMRASPPCPALRVQGPAPPLGTRERRLRVPRRRPARDPPESVVAAAVDGSPWSASLGGLLARGLAVRRPDLVAGIVTLGSPCSRGCPPRRVDASLDALVRLSRPACPA